MLKRERLSETLRISYGGCCLPTARVCLPRVTATDVELVY